MNQNFIENELIILSKQTIDLFLSHRKPVDLISLYTFYYYTAKWQKTNQPKCTTNYAAKGLHKTEAWVRKNKRILIELELIEDVQSKDKGKITGHYIKLNYIWGNETVKKASQTYDFTEGGKDHGMENNKGNTLNANTINTLSVNIVSKDTNSTSKEVPKLDLSENRYNNLFNYWNSILTTRNHKENTKRHENSVKLFRQLRLGTFYKNNALDKSYLKDNKIPANYSKKKWTDDEIKEALRHTAYSLLAGYSPDVCKDKWPKDLDALIFNPRTGKSMFLKCAVNPPKLLADEIKASPKNTACYEMYKRFFTVSDKIKSKKQENELILKFNDLWNEIHIIYALTGKYYKHTSFSSYLGSEKKPEIFFKEHIKWLSKRNKVFINMVGVDTYSWQNFTEYVAEEHGYILYPDSKQLKGLKREMESANRRMG